MYPNLVKDILTINGLSGGEEITIYNAHGQKVYTCQNREYQINIDVKIFRAGTYYLMVTDKNGGKIRESKITKIN